MQVGEKVQLHSNKEIINNTPRVNASKYCENQQGKDFNTVTPSDQNAIGYTSSLSLFLAHA